MLRRASLAAALAACGDNAPVCEVGPPPAASADCVACVDLYVVAHPDDDLLFMNPDIYADVLAGHHVVVVYITAGELTDPSTDCYWQDRERGIVNAYTYMLGGAAFESYRDGLPGEWTMAERSLGVRYDAGLVSLVFLRLGDFQTQCLWEQTNGCSGYNPYPSAPPYVAFTKGASHAVTRDGLVDALVAVMTDAGATSIHFLDASNVYFDELGSAGTGYREYWDHYFSGLFTLAAAVDYQATTPEPVSLASYRGYTVSREAANLTRSDACAKGDVFARYAMFDSGVAPRPTPDDFTRCPDCYISGDYRVMSPTSWQARRYATRTRDTSGRIATQAACVGVVAGEPAPVPCGDAPEWTFTPTHRIQLGDQCLAVDAAGYITRPSPSCDGVPCEPVPPLFPPDPVTLAPCAQGSVFFWFDNQQIRTANGRCLALTDRLESTDCAAQADGSPHVSGVPDLAQRWVP